MYTIESEINKASGWGQGWGLRGTEASRGCVVSMKAGSCWARDLSFVRARHSHVLSHRPPVSVNVATLPYFRRGQAVLVQLLLARVAHHSWRQDAALGTW